MTESSFQQPTQEQLAAFVQGDPIAIDEVVRLLLPQLYRWAVQYYQDVPRDEVQSTINATFAEVCRNHNRYDPSQSLLTTYIINLITWRMTDVSKKVAKLKDFIQEPQEKPHPEVYNNMSTSDIDNHISREKFFEQVFKRLDDTEKEFLRLMLEGEKDQNSYLAILNRNSNIEKPVAEVKNYKERIKRKMKATAQDLGYKSDDLIIQ